MVVRSGVAHDLANNGAVVFFDAATQSIGQKPLGEVLHEHVPLCSAEPRASPPAHSNGVPSGRVPDESIGPVPGPSGVAPPAEAVEVLQRKAERVHHPVANGALGTCAMLFHALTHGQLLRASASSFNDGTLGGGGGGGVPRSCSSTHFPRIVGAVRLG